MSKLSNSNICEYNKLEIQYSKGKSIEINFFEPFFNLNSNGIAV